MMLTRIFHLKLHKVFKEKNLFFFFLPPSGPVSLGLPTSWLCGDRKGLLGILFIELLNIHSRKMSDAA